MAFNLAQVFAHAQISLVVGPTVNGLLRGSWDLASTVISILMGVIAKYEYSHLPYSPGYIVS